MATKKKSTEETTVEEQPKKKTPRKPKAVPVNKEPEVVEPVKENIPAPGEQRDVDPSEIPQEVRDQMLNALGNSNSSVASVLAGMFAQTPPAPDANLFTNGPAPVEEPTEEEHPHEDEEENEASYDDSEFTGGTAPPPISHKKSNGGSFRAFDYMNEDKEAAAAKKDPTKPDQVEVISDSYHDYGLNSVDEHGNVQNNQNNDLIMQLLMNAAKKNEEGVEFNDGVKQILAGILKTLEIHDYNTDTLFDKVNKINGLLSKELLISVGAILLSSIAIISSLNSGRKTRRIKHEIRRRGI